jgi:hypothetical protein
MDTGIQSADAAGGALFTAVPRDPASVTSLKANLRAVRPFGGTPIAAALDDLYYYFAEDPNGAPARQASAGRYVILITDGYPDDDFRVYPTPGCACATPEACGGRVSETSPLSPVQRGVPGHPTRGYGGFDEH